MTLNQLKIGESATIAKVDCSNSEGTFLGKLGFVPESELRVLNRLGGNMIVILRDSRIAISKEMALRITVVPKGELSGEIEEVKL